MFALYDLLYCLAFLLGWPLLLLRRWKRGPGSLALGERLGNVPSRQVSADCVWIHGVSLGEINATRTLVAELHKRRPELQVVISSTTNTGLDRARTLYPKLTVFRFPLDFSFIYRRLVERIRPSAVVLMELEAWPNLLEVAQREHLPVLIANGRVTEEKTMRRFRQPVLRGLARRMFSRLSWVGAQDKVYAERFVELGVPRERVEITGSLKYDAADVADRIDGQDELASQMTIDRRKPLLVCGSTGPGEETTILDVHAALLPAFPTLQLAIVPRKPERFQEVAELIAARGYACLRRSGPPLVPRNVAEPRPVFLGDTMGELRKFYALATIVFVGRSLAPMGGSDVMEVAGLAKPMLVGPFTENFSEAVALLSGCGACRVVKNADDFRAQMDLWLRDEAARRQAGLAGQQAILSRRGATARTVERLLEFVS